MRQFIFVTPEVYVPSPFDTDVHSLLMPRHTLLPNMDGVRDEHPLFEERLRDQLKERLRWSVHLNWLSHWSFIYVKKIISVLAWVYVQGIDFYFIVIFCFLFSWTCLVHLCSLHICGYCKAKQVPCIRWLRPQFESSKNRVDLLKRHDNSLYLCCSDQK